MKRRDTWEWKCPTCLEVLTGSDPSKVLDAGEAHVCAVRLVRVRRKRAGRVRVPDPMSVYELHEQRHHAGKKLGGWPIAECNAPICVEARFREPLIVLMEHRERFASPFPTQGGQK